MKNYTIPRTMESGRWSYDCDPIQKFEGDTWGRYGMGALVILFAVVVVLVWMTR